MPADPWSLERAGTTHRRLSQGAARRQGARLRRTHLLPGKQAYLLPCLVRAEQDIQASIWKTPSGKAGFTVPSVLDAGGENEAPGRFTLVTLRANDQFNTTIYHNSDRLRGLEGDRMIVLINPEEMQRAQLSEGDLVPLDRHDQLSKTPAAKGVPVRIRRACV